VHKGVYGIVDALRRGALSRNREFDRMSGTEGRRARRIHQLLLALGRELGDPRSEVELERTAGSPSRFSLTIRRADVRVRRVTYLAAEEIELLRQDPRLRKCLTAFAQATADGAAG
jgi:hypothetical protein